MVIGTDSSPFEADVKALLTVFDKVLMVPRPDYGARLALWEHALRRFGGQITPALDLHSLAKVSDGYTPHDIVTTVATILGPMRKKQQLIKVGCGTWLEEAKKYGQESFGKCRAPGPL